MSTDLQTQIHDYAEYFGSTLPAVDLDAVLAETEPEGLIERSRRRPRWLVTAAAALTVLVLIGIAAVLANLFGSDRDPVIDSPTTTTPQATTTVPPGPAFQSLPSTFQDSNGVRLGEVYVTDGVTTVDPAAAGILQAVTEQLLSDPSFGLGDNREERERRLLGCSSESSDCTGRTGDLRIHLALDWELQREADRILDTWLSESGGPIGSIVMIDNETGAILVAAPGSLRLPDDLDPRPAGPLEPAIRANTSSAAKPFALVAALESGIGLNSLWDITNTLEVPNPDGVGEPIVCTGGRGGGGERSLEVSTYLSTDVVYCQVGIEVGGAALADTVHRITGVDSLAPSLPGVALGEFEASQIEMAGAYATLANYGKRVQPHFVERIDDTDGNLLYRAATAGDQVIDAALAAAVVNTLEEVIARGTGTQADIDRPQAGKTGSNDPFFTDVWFIGFTPRFTTAVWVGTTDNTAMTNLTINGRFKTRWFGGDLAAPLWAEFMTIALEGTPIRQFPPDPEGTEKYYSSQRRAE